MKIRTSKKNRVNMTVQLMDDVLVKFDDKLEGELEDESKLEAILERDPSISVIGDESNIEVEETEVEKTKEPVATEAEVVKEEVEEPKAEETKEIPKEEVEKHLSLEDLKVEELKDLCKDAGLEEKEWKDLKKAELIAYVSSNLED